MFARCPLVDFFTLCKSYRLPGITMTTASCILQKYPSYSRSVSSTASASSNVSHLMLSFYHSSIFLNSTWAKIDFRAFPLFITVYQNFTTTFHFLPGEFFFLLLVFLYLTSIYLHTKWLRASTGIPHYNENKSLSRQSWRLSHNRCYINAGSIKVQKEILFNSA